MLKGEIWACVLNNRLAFCIQDYGSHDIKCGNRDSVDELVHLMDDYAIVTPEVFMTWGK